MVCVACLRPCPCSLSPAGLAVAFLIVALVPLRERVLVRIFSEEELHRLDGPLCGGGGAAGEAVTDMEAAAPCSSSVRGDADETDADATEEEGADSVGAHHELHHDLHAGTRTTSAAPAHPREQQQQPPPAVGAADFD